MPGGYWLFKSEPGAYSYYDLVADGVAEWDGVRNFQARNFLRDRVAVGHSVLFYHSNIKEPAVIGTANVVRAGYPDHTAWDEQSAHRDSRSTLEFPIWYMVDIKAAECFLRPVTLQAIRSNPNLDNMILLGRGVRLSIQPVTQEEFHIVCELGRQF